jgi:dCMP deaminase
MNEFFFSPHVDVDRPDWPDYFMALAWLASMRSHDVNTKHGCVITDRENHILGSGYNGFLPKTDDSKWPNTRPESMSYFELNKHDFIIHAERNAIANCVIQPKNGIAYVTGQCCTDCTTALAIHGVRTIYMMAGRSFKLWDERMAVVFDTIIKSTGIEIHKIEPDFSWCNFPSRTEVKND